ncbi:MAG: HAD family hydrolase [Planctomycetaceae bacterium]
MTTELVDRIRELCSPLTPIPTGEQPALSALPGIRAVLFDVYGTLLISAGGDMGMEVSEDVTKAASDAFRGATRAAGLLSEGRVAEFFETIRTHHRRAREAGITFPEVDVVAVLREVLEGDAYKLSEAMLQRVAVEFECRVNPVWPMPHARECLARLRDTGRILGIVSNAQFYSPLTLEALLGKSPEQLGFETVLQFFSYKRGQAKPSPFLFQQAAHTLKGCGIAPEEAVYVGNDLLKDVMPAASVGFRTALFAGDRRSLRKRDGDARVAGVVPDVVLTSLDQLERCLE